MTSEAQNSNVKTTYDLQERTAKFGEDIILFVQKLPRNEVTRPLISQLVRSATSIGANYMEADSAFTKKDFRHKIALCKKESKETMHWLRMVATADPALKVICRTLWQETHELALIFSAIILRKKV